MAHLPVVVARPVSLPCLRLLAQQPLGFLRFDELLGFRGERRLVQADAKLLLHPSGKRHSLGVVVQRPNLGEVIVECVRKDVACPSWSTSGHLAVFNVAVAHHRCCLSITI